MDTDEHGFQTRLEGQPKLKAPTELFYPGSSVVKLILYGGNS